MDETKLKMIDMQDQLENMTKSMEKSQETVVEKPVRKSSLKKPRPSKLTKSLYKKKKSHFKPVLKKNKENIIDYQDLVDQLDENEAMLRSIERKLLASEQEKRKIFSESSYRKNIYSSQT